jgi:hypothetical protein
MAKSEICIEMDKLTEIVEKMVNEACSGHEIKTDGNSLLMDFLKQKEKIIEMVGGHKKD